MKNSASRKPIAHFFVLKSLQLRLIYKVVGVVLLTTIISLGTVFLVYFFKYHTVVMYRLDKVTQDLTHDNIFSLILPTLLFSAFVNILVAVGIGFYASRKYAIPVYKLEQWCSLLLQGKLAAMLQFREREELKELSSKCNDLTQFFRQRLIIIKREVNGIKLAHPDSPAAAKMEQALQGLDLAADPIPVNTSFYKMALKKESEGK